MINMKEAFSCLRIAAEGLRKAAPRATAGEYVDAAFDSIDDDAAATLLPFEEPATIYSSPCLMRLLALMPMSRCRCA